MDVDAYDIPTFRSVRIGHVELRVTYTFPVASHPSPTDKNISSSFPSLFSVYCSDPEGDMMNATWWSNSSGSWVQFGSNETSFGNGTIEQINNNFSSYNQTYWWNVSLNDGMGNWDNNTYSFKVHEWLITDDTANYEAPSQNDKNYGASTTIAMRNTPIGIANNATWAFRFNITGIPAK